MKTDALISIVHPKQRGRVISGNDELQGGVTAQVVARAVAARALAARARAEAAAGDCVTDDGALYTRVQEGPTRRWVAGRKTSELELGLSLCEKADLASLTWICDVEQLHTDTALVLDVSTRVVAASVDLLLRCVDDHAHRWVAEVATSVLTSSILRCSLPCDNLASLTWI